MSCQTPSLRRQYRETVPAAMVTSVKSARCQNRPPIARSPRPLVLTVRKPERTYTR
jgi:hypothetical protein